MANNTDVQTLGGVAILLAVLAAVVALAWHGTLTGVEADVIFTTIVTLGGGALAVHSGAKVGARAAGVSDPPAEPVVATKTETAKAAKPSG